jgi:hypothetical protein
VGKLGAGAFSENPPVVRHRHGCDGGCDAPLDHLTSISETHKKLPVPDPYFSLPGCKETFD